jgi:hypothetical protein
MNHLSENNLLNSFQSAYVKSHSTETTLLSVHDYIIRAMSLQQVTCLCLLDLSAAFDTIDHSILLALIVLSCLGLNHIFCIDPFMSILMAVNRPFSSTLCLLAVQRVGYCYDPVCLSVCPHKTRNCEETERRTKKVLEIKVVGYDDSYSGVPSFVTSDDL